MLATGGGGVAHGYCQHTFQVQTVPSYSLRCTQNDFRTVVHYFRLFNFPGLSLGPYRGIRDCLSSTFISDFLNTVSFTAR